MYHHLSRSLYRRLARLLEAQCPSDELGRRRQVLLDACEMTMMRLATDPDYFAAPERFLFTSIRTLYPIHSQLRIRLIVDHELGRAREALAEVTAGLRRDCAATTRQGTPCRREPLDGGRYCPSHRHLDFELEAP